MQIDTKNRDHEGPGFKQGPLPRSALAPPGATYSGLLECPCTTRIKKEVFQGYKTLSEGGSCADPLANASECFSAVPRILQAAGFRTASGANASRPKGCSVEAQQDGIIDIFWNDATGRVVKRGSQVAHLHHVVACAKTDVVNVTIELREDGSPDGGEAIITLTGPADRWFGVGFGSGSMCLKMEADECTGGGPYAIIVTGDGADAITERKLDFHGPGHALQASVKTRSSSVEAGIRSVVLARSLRGPSQDHYTFDPQSASLQFITAKGASLVFAQHHGHASGALDFVAVESPTAVCRDGIRGTIGGQQFPYPSPCAAEPSGDLLEQHNPVCSVQTYGGGKRCCIHGHYLLDEDQEVPEGYQEYRLKWRFYFEEYQPRKVPSHQNLVRLYWQTEVYAGEYDIVPCLPGTPPQECIQVITARWKVHTMMMDCSLRDKDIGCTGVGSTDPARTAGIQLIYAGPHCHAPDCLSMELYNADTGRLLCRMEPQFGASDHVYDERGYVALPPCLWGEASDGLLEPELLSLDTELLSIKRNNNTVGHYGEMASWQMRGVVVPRGGTGLEPAPGRPRRRWDIVV